MIILSPSTTRAKRLAEDIFQAGLPAVYYEPGTDLSALLYDVLNREGC